MLIEYCPNTHADSRLFLLLRQDVLSTLIYTKNDMYANEVMRY